MNIGFFSETYKPDINGVITSIESFRQELEADGHTVYVFAPDQRFFQMPWQKSKRERRVFRFGSFQYPAYKSIRVAMPLNIPVARKIPSLKLDVVHSHTPFSLGLFASWVARKYDIPHVHTYHTLYPEYAKFYFPGFKKWNQKGAEKLSALFCNQATEIIAPSDDIRRKLRSYGIRRPVTTLPTGVDKEFFTVKDPDHGIRKRFGIPQAAPLLITVARLGREKSIDFILRSFVKVRKQRPDAYYLIVGDGPARLELETLSKELGVADRVVFTGFLGSRTDVVRAYANADLFVFASRTDTQCLTILEAAATGLPVVAVKDKPLELALHHGRNGYAVPPREVAFADKAVALLADKARMRRFGAESRKIARGLSAKQQAKKLVTIYERARAEEFSPQDPKRLSEAFRRVRKGFDLRSRIRR
ncbi:MAG TPA: glycosyltransferase family 4 protein [Patescibacteria group bacterium]|jgi:glycosyltransferase involved in cell wall biosynthesis